VDREGQTLTYVLQDYNLEMYAKDPFTSSSLLSRKPESCLRKFVEQLGKIATEVAPKDSTLMLYNLLWTVWNDVGDFIGGGKMLRRD
jgi:hypothetical protein